MRGAYGAMILHSLPDGPAWHFTSRTQAEAPTVMQSGPQSISLMEPGLRGLTSASEPEN
jgi:hypothetical protein